MYTELKSLINIVSIIKIKFMVEVYTYTNVLIQVKHVWKKPLKKVNWILWTKQVTSLMPRSSQQDEGQRF